MYPGPFPSQVQVPAWFKFQINSESESNFKSKFSGISHPMPVVLRQPESRSDSESVLP
jgi:hypothetical protein